MFKPSKVGDICGADLRKTPMDSLMERNSMFVPAIARKMPKTQQIRRPVLTVRLVNHFSAQQKPPDEVGSPLILLCNGLKLGCV